MYLFLLYNKMDFLIAKFVCLNKRISNIKENNNKRKQLIKYRNKCLFKILKLKCEYERSKIIDLDNYKPLSLSEKIRRKQKSHFIKDNIDIKIHEVIDLNKLYKIIPQPVEFGFIKKWDSGIQQYRIDKYSIVLPEEREKCFKNLENLRFNIIDLLLISKNINNFQKKKELKERAFKLRCMNKLINYIYISRKEPIKFNNNDSVKYR